MKKYKRAMLIVFAVLAATCGTAFAANFDATVPASLPITVSSDEVVKTATNAAIHNYGSSPILVSSINVTAENGWSLATKDAAASASIGAKVISMGFNGSWMDASGAVDTSGFERIAASGTLAISYDAKVPGAIAEETAATAATATLVVGFVPEPPTMAAGSSWYKSTKNRNTITKITFMDSYTPSATADETWNADVNDTGDIKCYRTGTEIVIAGNGAGKIKANADSSYMFSCSTYDSEFRKLTSIENLSLLDTSKVTSMYDMFLRCSGLTSLDVSYFDTSNVTNMAQMFYYCGRLTSLDVSGFDTSNVTRMFNMFYYCAGLTSLDVSGFDTSNVTNMAGMFWGCSGLTSLDVSGFDTSNATNMDGMFGYCNGLTSLDVSGFDTFKVTNMYNMFLSCSGLTSLDLSSFDTSKVTSISQMFSHCSGLTSLDLSSFDTSNVTSMYDMFGSCSGLTSLDLSSFDTSNVTSMDYMFRSCNRLTSLDLSSFDTSRVTSMRCMFLGCSGLTTIYASDKWNTHNVTNRDNSSNVFNGCTKLKGAISYDTSKTDATYANWTTGYLTYRGQPATLAAGPSWYKSKQNRNTITKITFMDSYTPSATTDETWNADVNDTGDIKCYRTGTEIVIAGNGAGKIKANADSSYMFSCSTYESEFRKLTSIENLSLLDTSKVTSMYDMFLSCSGLTSLDVSYFDTSNVTNMAQMFLYCHALTGLDVSGFDTANVTNMASMFQDCSGLTSLDVSGFDTANVTNMHYMFLDCSGLTSLDLSGFDTAKVTNMHYMFGHCSGLTSLDVSGFDTANVTSMSLMFCSCSGLTSLDVSGFDTANVTDIFDMFQDCSGLTSLDVSGFDTANVTNMGGMFQSCSGLTSLDISGFDTSNVTYMSAMFDNCSGLMSIYASDKWNTNKVTYSDNMFNNCTKLKGSISYDSSKTNVAYANWITGYFTYKAASTKTLSLNIDPNSGAITSYDVSTNPISRFRAFLDWSDTANVA